MEGLIITVNLLGTIGGFNKHNSDQLYTFKSRKGELASGLIKHTDRAELECKKIIRISQEVLQFWQSNEVPEWETERDWKRLSPNQRVWSYVKGLDEGFGIEYEYIR
jgi:hypothetical protein